MIHKNYNAKQRLTSSLEWQRHMVMVETYGDGSLKVKIHFNDHHGETIDFRVITQSTILCVGLQDHAPLSVAFRTDVF